MKEAGEELNEDLRVKLENDADPSKPVVSPVKVTLTTAEEGEEEESVDVVTLVSGDEDSGKSKAEPGVVPVPLWQRELLLLEKPQQEEEEYDSSVDCEYVPPATILDTSLEYDEYFTGEDEVSAEEVSSLIQESKAPLQPPSEYMAIWVRVNTIEERIAKAKEQQALSGSQQEAKEQQALSGSQ